MMNFLKNILGGAPSVDIKSLLENGAMLVDVRTPEEFKSGHIKGAVNIPLGTIANNINKLKNHKGAIVAYCRSGARSGSAVSEMKSYGLEAYNAGSISNLK